MDYRVNFIKKSNTKPNVKISIKRLFICLIFCFFATNGIGIINGVIDTMNQSPDMVPKELNLREKAKNYLTELGLDEKEATVMVSNASVSESNDEDINKVVDNEDESDEEFDLFSSTNIKRMKVIIWFVVVACAVCFMLFFIQYEASLYL